MDLFHSKYDQETKTLTGHHSSGFYSCINTVRVSLYELISKGIVPNKISFKDTLTWYKDDTEKDYYDLLYKTDFNNVFNIKTNFPLRDLCFTNTKHNKYDFKHLTPIENVYFQPSDHVLNNIDHFVKKYNINFDKTLAVFHRGNDKWKEIRLSPVDDWISIIEKFYKPDYKILIQTDEQEAKEKFINHFKDRCFVFDEMIFENDKKKNVIPKQNKEKWVLDFETVVRIISKCDFLINHTGNCAFIPIIYKGNTNKEIQFYDNQIFYYDKIG
jgi:hypothetical protein